MPRPEFSETEQYLIHSLQNEIPFQNRNESARKSLLATAAIATFAFYHDSIFLMLAALAMHFGFLAYDDYKANLCSPTKTQWAADFRMKSPNSRRIRREFASDIIPLISRRLKNRHDVVFSTACLRPDMEIGR